jgi:hypothetical protein
MYICIILTINRGSFPKGINWWIFLIETLFSLSWEMNFEMLLGLKSVFRGFKTVIVLENSIHKVTRNISTNIIHPVTQTDKYA